MELKIKILIIGIIIVSGSIGLLMWNEVMFEEPESYNDNILKYILDDCKDPKWYMTFKDYSNGTHSIDNKRCTWSEAVYDAFYNDKDLPIEKPVQDK